MHKLICGDALQIIPTLPPFVCTFADPPDNIGLKYASHRDKRPPKEYLAWLHQSVTLLCKSSKIVWLSYNTRWAFHVGGIVGRVEDEFNATLEAKHCVQVYTFGQHNHRDLGNNHRPLARLMHKTAILYPDQIRVPSWRQENGDKRADPRGRVPGDVFDHQYPDAKPGDVFDFPRVTGNSKQRCNWHPTQLHEELIERCLKFSTREGDLVLDPFAGTGTTLRVCRRIGRPCTLIDSDRSYCERIATENGLSPAGDGVWEGE